MSNNLYFALKSEILNNFEILNWVEIMFYIPKRFPIFIESSSKTEKNIYKILSLVFFFQ